MVAMAPPKARPVTTQEEADSSAEEESSQIPHAAPKDAPWEIPRVEGEASGLLSNTWRMSPAVARAAPPRMALHVRGRRICTNTRCEALRP